MYFCLNREFKKPDLNTFLKNAKLTGFRTIRDVYVSFNPGLNIIIGKNGSGKTNFLSFLKKAIDLDYKALGYFNFKLDFSGDTDYSLVAYRQFKVFKKKKPSAFFGDRLLESDVLITLSKDGKPRTYDSAEKIGKDRPDHNQTIQFIGHGIDVHGFKDFITEPFSFSVDYKHGTSEDLLIAFNEGSKSLFVGDLIKHLLIELFNRDQQNQIGGITKEILREVVEKVLNLFVDHINRNIGKYLPITGIRLSPNYQIYQDIENEVLKCEGLMLEFHSNNDWLPFSSLSDGTKRLFYIYAELNASDVYDATELGLPAENKIILLEEPELGIHPHQLHLLMILLKEVSERNQVIITTHAPQALNIVSDTELGAINICTFNAENGTMIKKLNDDQIAKAKKYMDEMYLSDYWTYSNLEERD